MSQIEKLLQKFARSPQNVRYADIEVILSHFGFEKIPAKGSHIKWKHSLLRNDIIIPVHKNECKNFYKEQIYKNIRNLIQK
jgi:predicted RNA binding protein YcfA (HicA-like mRNA interferase family)